MAKLIYKKRFSFVNVYAIITLCNSYTTPFIWYDIIFFPKMKSKAETKNYYCVYFWNIVV